MKAYEGFSAKKDYGDGFGRLPAGNYIGKIKSAKVEEFNWGSFLVIAFDITEGDYAGWFQKMFDSDSSDTKKWKGTCRIKIPNASSQYFVSEKRNFENAIACIEESNPRFHWDWDETKLKGKVAGFRFRDKEFLNTFGEVIEFTECLNLASVDDVKTGKAKLLKPKKLKDEEKPASSAPVEPIKDLDVIDADDDLPF